MTFESIKKRLAGNKVVRAQLRLVVKMNSVVSLILWRWTLGNSRGTWVWKSSKEHSQKIWEFVQRHAVSNSSKSCRTGRCTLMNKYLGGEELTIDEIKAGIRKGVLSGNVFPLFCGSALANVGVQKVLDGVVDYLPITSRYQRRNYLWYWSRRWCKKKLLSNNSILILSQHLHSRSWQIHLSVVLLSSACTQAFQVRYSCDKC